LAVERTKILGASVGGAFTSLRHRIHQANRRSRGACLTFEDEIVCGNALEADSRSLISSHVPSRVLTQPVKFHPAGGGDRSAQPHQVEVDGDETFDQAFLRTIAERRGSSG